MKVTYDFKGDGPLVLQCYETMDSLYAVVVLLLRVRQEGRL